MTNPIDDFASGDCGQNSPCVSQFLDECPQNMECQEVIQALVAKCGTCSDSYTFEMRVRTVVSKRCSDEVPDALKAKIFMALQQVRDER
ncbi:MAG: hypothetical protein AAGA37_09535 [Actinomycetota bacterium]